MTRTRAFLTLSVAAALIAVPATAAVRDPVISSNQPLPFPRNAQNEPALALDRRPKPPGPLLIGGGNDYRDQPVCSGQSACGFAAGVGISGVYYSDNAAAWTSPATGLKTVPNFTPSRWSFGDPALASGPRPAGGFSWANGSRFYYATLAATSSKPDRVITVSYADPTKRVRLGFPHWSKPRVISGASPSSDKPAIWADDAARFAGQKANPGFGHVYVCWTAFPSDDAAETALGGQIWYTRSLNGGLKWTKPVQLSTTKPDAAQGCAIRSDNRGAVYVLWRERRLAVPTLDSVANGATCAKVFRSTIVMTRSVNGVAFSPPAPVASVAEPGQYDRVQGQCTADGVAGARTNSFPSVDIANGAPLGNGPNTIAIAGAEENGRIVVRVSHTLGSTWSGPLTVSRANDVGALPAVALSPNGLSLFVVYQAFLQPWQASPLAGPRVMQGVVRTTSLKTLEASWPTTAWGEVDGAKGDARASAGFEGGDKTDAKPISAEFVGDYDAIVATNSYARAAWTDVSAAQDCGPVDSYRYASSVGKTQDLPPLKSACPAERAGTLVRTFGNTTLCGASIQAGSRTAVAETQCPTDPH